MRQKIDALVLGLVRHSERTDVATLYTRQLGRLSVAVPVAKGPRRRGANPPLMPLSVIEGEVSDRPGSELARLWRFSLLEPFVAMRADPLKSAVAMFVGEFLGRLLREQAPDPALWQAVYAALRRLDAETDPRRTANFHIVLLWQMLAPAGIIPDLTSRRSGEEQWLDMRSGLYTSIRPPHGDVLPPRHADLPPLLARLTLANSHALCLSGEDRYLVCEALLHYYAVHLPGLGTVRSHHILRELFR